jgi:hypothetical protein
MGALLGSVVALEAYAGMLALKYEKVSLKITSKIINTLL